MASKDTCNKIWSNLCRTLGQSVAIFSSTNLSMNLNSPVINTFWCSLSGVQRDINIAVGRVGKILDGVVSYSANEIGSWIN